MTPTPTIFIQLHWKKTLMLGKMEGKRRRRQQRMRRLDVHHWKDMSLSKLWRWWRTGKPGVLQPAGSQSRTRLSDWANWNYNHVKMCIINFSKNNKSTEKKVPSERGGLFHNLNLHLLNFPECSHFKAPLGDALRMLMDRANSFITNGKLLFFIFW